jgi:putative tricarboxylic transport membrane protein
MTASSETLPWAPAQQVEFVAGTPPGGGQDRPARAFIKALQESGAGSVDFRVSNIAGLGGANAWRYLAGQTGNPHVLAVSSPTLVTNRLLGVDGLDFETLTPLANLYTEYILFLVRADSPMASAGDLAERLGRDTAGLKVALATARGNINHIALAWVARHAGGSPRALALNVFDSARYAVADVLAGNAEVAAVTAVSAAPELAAGTLRALAVSAPVRLPAPLARVPTWAELGVPCVLGTWRGLIGPPGLEEGAVAWWDAAFARAAASPRWTGELAAQSWSADFRGSRATLAFLHEQRDAMRHALTDIGMLAYRRP